jgi:hypothetical protein
MACKLSNDQLDALYKATVGEIVANKVNGEKFSPATFMKKIYDAISAATGDTANGLDYVQHIPWAINLAQGLDMEVADYLIDSGVDINNIHKLRRDFENIDNIINYLGLNKNAELETAKEIISKALPEKIINTKEYDGVESKDQEIKKTQYGLLYKETGEGEFIAKPDSALATINQEAKNYDGYDAKDNVIDDDKQKKAYFTIVRTLNDAIAANGAINADNVQIGDVKGIFFKAVPAKELAIEDLYLQQQDYFSKDDDPSKRYAKTREQKLSDRENGSDMLLVFSDKDGNILYFNENAAITTKEKGGKPLYTAVRGVITDDRGSKFVRSVQSVAVLSGKPGALAKDQIQETRDKEIELLENLRKYVVSNPTETVLLSVAPGKNGFVKEDFSKRNLISSIDMEGGFIPSYSSTEEKYKVKGGVYFNVSDYELPILIYRPKFSEVSGLVDALANVLFDSNLSNNKKEEIVKQFTYSEDTSIFVEDNVVKIKQGADKLDTSLPEDKQKFIDNINKQTVNINKDLLAHGYYTEPTIVNGELKVNEGKLYGNFLANNFFTFLEKNAENKIVKLNAYNTFQLTKQAAEKIFKVDAPKQESAPLSKITAETPTDQSLSDFQKAIRNIDTSLKKLRSLDNTATDEQIAEAQKWYDNHPLKAHAPYEVMLNVVNSDAFAEWTQAGIFLYQGSNFTDLYHESWHVFSQMYLTRDQKKKLYGEVAKLSGTFKTYDGKTVKFSKATDKQLEEFLAEDFRKYVLSKGTKIFENRPVATNIFSKIWNFLKELFKGQSIKSILADASVKGTVKELYDKLHVGNVNEYKPSLANVQFSILNKGIQEVGAKPEENKGLNYQDSLEVTQTLDALVASLLAQYNLSPSTVFTNPELLGALYAEVKKEVAKLRDNLLTKAPEVTQSVSKESIEKKKQEKLNKLWKESVEKEDRDALDKIYNTNKIGDKISIGVYTFTKTGKDEWTSSDDAGEFSLSSEKLAKSVAIENSM